MSNPTPIGVFKDLVRRRERRSRKKSSISDTKYDLLGDDISNREDDLENRLNMIPPLIGIICCMTLGAIILSIIGIFLPINNGGGGGGSGPIINGTCTSDSECEVIGNPCLERTCNLTTNMCQNSVVGGGTCYLTDMCVFGNFCDLSSCNCASDCAGDPCVSDACTIRTCASTGVCVVQDYTPGCCLDDSQCDQFDPEFPCHESYCSINNTCATRIPDAGECISNSDCIGNLTCDPTTCGCIDLCDGVFCESNLCETQKCDFLTGHCVIKDIVPNCCTNATECSTINSCYIPSCTLNTCHQSVPIGQCGKDSDCMQRGSVCVNCFCTPPLAPPCVTNMDCNDNNTCTLDVCAPAGCEFISLPNCCENDIDCEDNNECTNSTCEIDTGRCIYEQVDRDGDNWLCGTDCDDNNTDIGGPVIWYRDNDGDGQGNGMNQISSCTQPSGFVIDDRDCNDEDGDLFSSRLICDPSNQDILVGPSFGINCGYSVSVSENVMAMSCPNFNITESPSDSRVQVLRKSTDSQQWINLLTITMDDSTNRTETFGYSISLFEDLLAIGCPNPEDGSDGYVQVYRLDYTLNIAIFLQEIPADASTSFGSFFGGSVDINNDTLVISAYLDNRGGDPESGSTFVYRQIIPGAWLFEQQLIPSFSGPYAWFGHSVATNGPSIVVGAPTPGDDQPLRVLFSGIFVYQYNGTIWNEVFNFLVPDVGGNSSSVGSGFAVDIDEVNILATRLRRPSLGGGAEIFDLVTFIPTLLVVNDNSGGDGFGYSGSISNGIALVGAPFATINGNDDLTRGKAHLFTFGDYDTFGTPQWGSATAIRPIDQSALNTTFGFSVATTGSILAFGNPERDDGDGATYTAECAIFFTCPP